MEGTGLAISTTHYITTVMTIKTVPFALPPSADTSKLSSFGREVIGTDPGDLSSSDFAEIQDLLYKVPILRADALEHSLILFQYDALLFRNVNISPEQQYALTKVQYLHMSTEPHQPLLQTSRADAHPSFHRIP